MATNIIGKGILGKSSGVYQLLENADNVGSVFRLDGFHTAMIVTHDAWVDDAFGVPQHAFLLACVGDLGATEPSGAVPARDREVILLRVVDTVALPDDGEMQRLRAQIASDLVANTRRESARRMDPDQLVDPLTSSAVATFGLKCAVLGTFFDDRNGKLDFGSDLDTVYASRRLFVKKPHGDSLSMIASFIMEENADPTKPSKRVQIGNLRYASTRRREELANAAGKSTSVPVEIDIADIVAHKTAVFGMTRLGKSNTMKVLATSVYRYGKETGQKIGQLIFDPASEYSEENVQDGTALAKISDTDVRRYKFAATQAEVTGGDYSPLAINLFDESLIESASDLVGSHITAQGAGKYVEAFAAADVVGPSDPTDPDFRSLMTRARRARGLFYATLNKANLQVPTGWTYHLPMKDALRQEVAQIQHPQGRSLQFLSGKQTTKGPHGLVGVTLNAQELTTVTETICHAKAIATTDEIESLRVSWRRLLLGLQPLKVEVFVLGRGHVADG